MSRPDDEALSWDGDDDPTLSREPVRTPGTPSEETEVADGEPEGAAITDVTRADAERPEDSADPDLAVAGETEGTAGTRRMGDAALVFVGVLSGVYLLWTTGWVLGVMRMSRAIAGTPDPMFLASMVLGVLAPAIWFGAAWFLTRGRAGWTRIAALLGGIVVLVPWPFVMVGVIGQ